MLQSGVQESLSECAENPVSSKTAVFKACLGLHLAPAQPGSGGTAERHGSYSRGLGRDFLQDLQDRRSL